MRLTKKIDLDKGKPSYCEPTHLEEYKTKNKHLAINKLGPLEDIEEKMDVDLVRFLTELNYVLDNASETVGHTTKGRKIVTDYGYVKDFLKELKEALL